MLILDAEIDAHHQAGRRVDVRIDAGRIAMLAPAGSLRAEVGEEKLEAAGCLLLPGLHDHHLHLAALAVSLDSLRCGPPDVGTAEALASRLEQQAASSGDEFNVGDEGEGGAWLRGIAYHESVAGEIDRHWLDRVVPHRPVRIQHRSGRLWMVNSAGLRRLLSSGGARPAGMECVAGQPTGRIFDADDWLARRLPRRFPDLKKVGRLLARQGVTGVTDTTPRNGPEEWAHFLAARTSGDLPQALCLMGDARLDEQPDVAGMQRGALKIHLHEHDLPSLEALSTRIARSHAFDRPAAIHCVTLTELVFALGALECAGGHPGDRIEHAAIAPPDVLPLLLARGVSVVTQPNFIRERGDVYRRDVPGDEQPWLYRLRGFLAAGIPLAGSTDAPFGEPEPWLSMQAAVDRRTVTGDALGEEERLTPEEALALFLGSPLAPGGKARRIQTGQIADLCLLDRPWQQARSKLSAVRVAASLSAGRLLVD